MAVMATRIESMNWQIGRDHQGTRWSINTGLRVRLQSTWGESNSRCGWLNFPISYWAWPVCLDSRVRRTGCEHAVPGSGMESDRKNVIGRLTVVGIHYEVRRARVLEV